MDTKEIQRLAIQCELDRAKTQGERNRIGQFATPTTLATDMLAFAASLLPSDQSIRFLDPAIGTGSFFSALLRTFPPTRIASAEGYEIDAECVRKASTLWENSALTLHCADFTRSQPPRSEDAKANLLICNPPYVRYHHLTSEGKLRLQKTVERYAHIKLSGLAGLYCYFLGIAHEWLAENGIAGWLIPGEFMDVNYGERVKYYLLHHVTLLRVHRFHPNDLQFQDALVSSSVIWYKKALPPADHTVEFTYGGSLTTPQSSIRISIASLCGTPKWTGIVLSDGRTNGAVVRTSTRKDVEEKPSILSDLFEIRRGIATGANTYFLLTEDRIAAYCIPPQFVTPVLPGPRYLSENEIIADPSGNPLIARKLFLFTCDLPEDIVRASYPSVWRYLQTGIEQGINTGYLCRHRRPWYSQEKRPAPSLLCTYMGRQESKNRLFRFILNHSKATATNVYLLLYPKPLVRRVLQNKPELLRSIWEHLNAIPLQILLQEGRVYGDGLHKLEPDELAKVPLGALTGELSALIEMPSSVPITLFTLPG